MAICKQCNNNIPSRIQLDGKEYNLQNRKHCTTCVPFKSGTRLNRRNTRTRTYNIGKCLRCLQTKKLPAKELCTSCHVTLSRNKIKLKAVEYKGGSCQRCGYNRYKEVLTFHHRDPAKKDFTISGQYVKWDKVKNEIDKCDLLCQNCHTEIHVDLRIGAEYPSRTGFSCSSDKR